MCVNSEHKQNEYCNLVFFFFVTKTMLTDCYISLSSFGSVYSVRATAAALASVPDFKRATGGYLFIIWHHTHIYIQTPLLLYLFWERSREVVCVARFCSQRGTRPAAQSPSEAAAGFSERSKLDLPSSFQSFVFLCFHVKWTDEILSLLISGTQNHRFKPRAKTPQAQFHLKADTAILLHHITNFHYTETLSEFMSQTL